MGVLLYVTLCFSLVVFRILSVTFTILIMICCGVGPWVHLVWDPVCFLCLDICLLLQPWEVSSHNFIRYIFYPLLSLSSFWNPYNVIVSMLDVVPEVP